MKINKDTLALIALSVFGATQLRASGTEVPNTVKYQTVGQLVPVTQCANAYTATIHCKHDNSDCVLTIKSSVFPTSVIPATTVAAYLAKAAAYEDAQSKCISAFSTSSNTGSRIENITLNHTHDAVDYSSESVGASGCSSCSASNATTSDNFLKVMVQRTQSLRDMTQPSSFGPGNFLGYDVTLTLFDYNGVSYVDAYSVEWDGTRRFSPSGNTFVDAIYASTKLFALYDASGNLTVTRSNAVRAVYVGKDGNSLNFELFQLDANRTGGRLISIAKPDGQVMVNFTYAVTSDDVTVA